MPVWHVCLCGMYLCSCRLQPAVAPKAEDQEALSTVRGIWSILQPGLNEQLDGNQRQRLWNELMSLLPDILPGLGLTGEQLFAPNPFWFGHFCPVASAIGLSTVMVSLSAATPTPLYFSQSICTVMSHCRPIAHCCISALHLHLYMSNYLVVICLLLCHMQAPHLVHQCLASCCLLLLSFKQAALFLVWLLHCSLKVYVRAFLVQQHVRTYSWMVVSWMQCVLLLQLRCLLDSCWHVWPPGLLKNWGGHLSSIMSRRHSEIAQKWQLRIQATLGRLDLANNMSLTVWVQR